MKVLAESTIKIDSIGMVCGFGTPQGSAIDNNMDEEIAERVFGVPRSVIDAWPWGIPAFSSDRRHAASVALQMLAKPEATREKFNRILSDHVKRASETGSLAESLVVLTPDVICTAAIKSL